MHRSALLLILAACAGEPPVEVPSFVTTTSADTLVVPVAHLSSEAAPRADGSWVVLATDEMSVHVLDFANHEVREHPGINKDEVPGAVSMMASGDTVFLGDFGLRRVTAWMPDGRRVDAVPIPIETRGSFPRARDAAGQWYFEFPPPPGSDGRGVLDSGAVVRADPMLTRFDTLVRVTPPAVMEVEQDGRIRLARLQLAGVDRWGVERDGTLWLARINQNQVFWYPAGGGASSSTRPLPDPIISVTEMDRQIYIRRYPEDQRPALAQTRFAAVKPPFERAFSDSRGRVWLFKSAVANDTIRSFQVTDPTGWLFSVTVPSYGVALGISDTHILMGEEFPGGFRVLRFGIPEEARP
ncbi:MAG TPA: hypothetical protein PLL69_01275 [Gemmatimonadales bacterium]|nr:hypothetical protein [Gemmatimonadales bacterium]